MARDLPDFDAPPVVEVSLSVQFDPLPNLRATQIGLLWNQFRDRFPKTEEHGPIDPQFELFGQQKSTRPRLELMETPPLPRFWFLNEAGTELIQVQNDRFIHNWRKAGEGASYPRYEKLRQTFEGELIEFWSIVEREKWGQLRPNQCEITYFNQIVSGPGWERHGQLGEILTLFQSKYSDTGLGEPEDVNLAVKYVLRNEKEEPIGRLHISTKPGLRKSDGKPVIGLSLTARLRPPGEMIEDTLWCLDFGRDAIVNGFASVTTTKMHQIWERKDV